MGILASLALLAAATAQGRRTELRLASRYAERSQAAAAAEAGLERAVAIAAQQAKGAVVPAAAYAGGDDDAALVVPGQGPGLVVADARINLNTASSDIIARLPGSDQATADRLVAERRRRNGAAGRKDPVDLPEPERIPPPAGLVEQPFPDAAALAAAVPAMQPLLAQPRFAAAVTFRSSGRIDLASAPQAVLVALGVDPELAKRNAGRRWAQRSEAFLALGLEDAGWNRRHLAVAPAAWRALAVAGRPGATMVAEAVIVVERDRLRIADAHRRESHDDRPGWILP